MVFYTQIILSAVFEPTDFKFLKHAVQNIKIRMVIRHFFIFKWDNPRYSTTQNVLIAWEKNDGMIRHTGHVFPEINIGKKTLPDSAAQPF